MLLNSVILIQAYTDQPRHSGQHLTNLRVSTGLLFSSLLEQLDAENQDKFVIIYDQQFGKETVCRNKSLNAYVFTHSLFYNYVVFQKFTAVCTICIVRALFYFLQPVILCTSYDFSDNPCSQHNTMTHCFFDVGPSSATLSQHWDSVLCLLGTLQISWIMW